MATFAIDSSDLRATAITSRRQTGCSPFGRLLDQDTGWIFEELACATLHDEVHEVTEEMAGRRIME